MHQCGTAVCKTQAPSLRKAIPRKRLRWPTSGPKTVVSKKRCNCQKAVISGKRHDSQSEAGRKSLLGSNETFNQNLEETLSLGNVQIANQKCQESHFTITAAIISAKL